MPNEYEALSQLARVTWHTSEEGGGPDVGISIGLGKGRALWVGEITNDRHADGGAEVAALGDSNGWWLMLYAGKGAGTKVFGKFVDAEGARTFCDLIEELAVKRSAPCP